MSDEETKVSEALDAVEKIKDPEERVRVMSAVLRAQTARGKKWQKERRELVLQMRSQTPPVPYRQIAERLGVSLATVQDLERGYTGSGKDRPRKPDGVTE